MRRGALRFKILTNLMDALTMLSMQRDIQLLMSKKPHDIWTMLKVFTDDPPKEIGKDGKPKDKDVDQWNHYQKKMKVKSIYILAQVAMHPTNRLPWVALPRFVPEKSKTGELQASRPRYYPARDQRYRDFLNSCSQEVDNKSFQGLRLKVVAALLRITMTNEPTGDTSDIVLDRVETRKQEDFQQFTDHFDWWLENTTGNYDEEYLAEAEETLQ